MKIFLAIVGMILAGLSGETRYEVKGTVLSVNNRPMGGVNVLVKGTPNGTATDMNGNFKIYLPQGRAVLFFVFLKQKPLEHAVEVRPGYQYEISVTLADKSQTFHKSLAVTGELPLHTPRITGRVYNQDNEILGGVRVIPENSVFKRTTDADGYFIIPLLNSDQAFTFTLPGYKALNVPFPSIERDEYSMKVVLVEDKSKFRKLKSFAQPVPASE